MEVNDEKDEKQVRGWFLGPTDTCGLKKLKADQRDGEGLDKEGGELREGSICKSNSEFQVESSLL